MKVARELGAIQLQKNSVVTVGTFDGMHRGHQAVLSLVRSKAEGRGGRSVMLTFEPHPRFVLKGGQNAPPLLSTLEERLEGARLQGIDLAIVIPFTPEFSQLSFREFYLEYVIGRVGVSEVVEGYDHHFGRDRQGSVGALEQLGREFGFAVHAVSPVSVDGEIVSSSQIRTHLQEGSVATAAKLIGRPYSWSGKVIKGEGRGRLLGYPTANLKPLAETKLVPSNGIYFASATTFGASRYGIASVGVRPTFESDGKRLVEVYFLEFSGDLYGAEVTVHFLQRLRDEMKFSSAEELVQQMHKDRERSLQLQHIAHAEAAARS